MKSQIGIIKITYGKTVDKESIRDALYLHAARFMIEAIELLLNQLGAPGPEEGLDEMMRFGTQGPPASCSPKELAIWKAQYALAIAKGIPPWGEDRGVNEPTQPCDWQSA